MISSHNLNSKELALSPYCFFSEGQVSPSSLSLVDELPESEIKTRIKVELSTNSKKRASRYEKIIIKSMATPRDYDRIL